MKGKEKIHIEHPEAWELIVDIAEGQVNYILFTPTVANSLIVGEVAWIDDTLQTLEDAVYDTPELLNEFKRVRVIVHSRHFVLFPDETSEGDCVKLLRHAFPADDGDAAVCPMPRNGVKIAYLMPRGMQAFLGRTFSYPMMCHHLMPLCEHFAELNSDKGFTGMLLNLDETCMDLAIYREGALQCANSYGFSDYHDAVYYALNAWRSHELDQLADELQLMGDREARAAMTPELRKFVKSVVPAEFPAAAMRLGRNAMQAPLGMILLALCE